MAEEGSNNKIYTIYVHRNKLNGKCYVGQTENPNITDRWRNGSGYSKQQYFWRAIQKYGWDQFEHIILCTCNSREEANRLECEYITKYDSLNNGYNIIDGGIGGGFVGHHHTPESKAIISQKVSGELNGFYGKQHTPETRKQLSELAKNRPGRTVSSEEREQIRIRQTGHIVSVKTREKISQSRKGFKMSQEVKEKIRATMKQKSKMKKRNQKGQFVKRS